MSRQIIWCSIIRNLVDEKHEVGISKKVTDLIDILYNKWRPQFSGLPRAGDLLTYSRLPGSKTSRVAPLSWVFASKLGLPLYLSSSGSLGHVSTILLAGGYMSQVTAK